MLSSDALDSSQPPPRRRYGRPNYSSGNTNPDGSEQVDLPRPALGLGLPVGNTHKYETPSWGFQVGGGRNFNKIVGVLLQFDYDHFGLQGATINEPGIRLQLLLHTVATGCGQLQSHHNPRRQQPHLVVHHRSHLYAGHRRLAGRVHRGGAAASIHKVTNFTLPTTGYYYSPYYGYVAYTASQNVDHYTSNAFGGNGGLGLTWKFSKFSNQRFYAEARYVVVLNQHYAGFTAANVGTTYGTSYNGYNYYPANSNRTTYIPIKFGIRF